MTTKTIKSTTMTSVLIAACIWFSGCATHGSLIVTRAVPGQNTIKSPSEVRVFPDSSMPRQPFDVVGQVSISLVNGGGPGAGGGQGANYEKDEHLHKACIEKMQNEAAAMGGNAIAGIYIYKAEAYDLSVRGKFPSFMTALVIKVPENGLPAEHPQGNFIVGIAPVESEETNAVEKEFARKWSFRSAQVQLAGKGYYVLPDPQDLHGEDFLALSKADPKEIASQCGEQAGSILGIQRASRHRRFVLVPGLLGTGEKDALGAALFSKADAKITWTNSATGFGATGWLISAFDPRAKEAFALGAGISQVLKDLPSVATTTQDVTYNGREIRAR